MTKRRILAAGLVAVFAATAAIVVHFTPVPEAATRVAFDRIALGMTEADVQALLGGPPQYRAPTKGLVLDSESFITNSDPATQARDGHRDYQFCEWIVAHWGGTSYAGVVFDGNVVVCRYLTVAPPGKSERVRRWLERLF